MVQRAVHSSPVEVFGGPWEGAIVASESTPPPEQGGGARYAIIGVALVAAAGLGYCMLQPSAPPPSTTVAVAPDAGPPQRPTSLVDETLTIPDEEVDAGVDAGEPDEPERPHATRVASGGSWDCTGELDGAAVRPVFEEFRPQFQACYEHRLKANPLLQGNMVLQVKVATDGHVDGVQVSGSLRDREVFSCVRNLANRMHFPRVTGGSCAVVQVPYSFTPRQ